MAETPADPTAAAKTAATTRKTTTVKRSTAAKKGAQTRAASSAGAARRRTTAKASAGATRTRTAAAKEPAETKTVAKTRYEEALEIAERSILVPVGAALVTRDRAMKLVNELRATYSTRTKSEAALKRFERRGAKALKPLLRDARKTRDRIEHELRYGRERVTQDVRTVVKDFEPVTKNVELVSARVESAVQGGKTAATKASTSVQERIAALA